MRIFSVLLVMLMIVSASCSSSKKSSKGDTTTVKTIGSVQDGSGYDKAIIITKTNESEGVAAEYAWLKENYPGYKMIRQSLKYQNNKPYDVLSIETKDGKKKDIYFDISNFFGKF